MFKYSTHHTLKPNLNYSPTLNFVSLDTKLIYDFKKKNWICYIMII